MAWDFISNVNSITRNATLYDALKAMKFADFAVWSEARFSRMSQNGADAAVTTTFKGINAVKIELTVNGLKIQAQYQNEEIENVHKPLLRMLAALRDSKSAAAYGGFLCAPPGTGKSTLTTFWEYLAQQDPELPAIQTLPMDGFHHYNSWLDAHQLRPSKAHQRHSTLRNWRKICAGLWKGIVRGRSTIDKSMILLKMRCTLPHHSSSSSKKLVVAGRREVVPACAIL